jgi:DNA-binding MarR family transcriptional regulator
MVDRAAHDPNACARAWQALRMAHDRVAARLSKELAATCELALNEFDVLLYLRTRGAEPVRIGALLDAVPLSQPAISRLIARLPERGLISRSEAEHEGRAVHLCLSAPGRDLIERAIEVHARVVQETLTGHFTPAEQEALLAILSRIGH